jgi:hypothetical protein
MDDRTRQGRNPEWRLAFEDRLGADARTHIRRAVKRGQGVPDPDEAAVAAGLARREQRAVLVQVAFLWFWAAAWGTLVVVVPFVLWRRFRLAHRAAEANDLSADQAQDHLA